MVGQRFAWAAKTDAGAVRQHNEDAFLLRPEHGLWAVADGMGGHLRGDHASRMVMDALAQGDAAAAIDEIRARIAVAHRALLREAASLGDGAVIGATAVILVVRDGRYTCLWAGDSRLYRLRDGVLRQLTRDHSYVQRLIDSGSLTPEEGRRHPGANVITRAVGASGPLELDLVEGDSRPGDVYLLCSDGLTNVVTDAEIADRLGALSCEQASVALLELALARGAPDNVTIVVIAHLADA
ncbi:PP2C family serine/threonine-protein phosphatase [Inquilinus sp. Marseille-Q2685]|uniref:PP2C family protein-serine/threonine phosphatase n=1 Tax=Inquilinus sp. Marseille-Q2685 TaxID=2866581 RepID=UPI001CE434B5|nr:protein phosphatase 2C domain-containing protein [Inquilinus sp. Marseille-Q2685]